MPKVGGGEFNADCDGDGTTDSDCRAYIGKLVDRIELTAATPQWTRLNNETQEARENARLVLLPGGRVMLVGGVTPRGPGCSDEGTCRCHSLTQCHIYDDTDQDICATLRSSEWADLFQPGGDGPELNLLASFSGRPAFHSAAILLRVGRLLTAGGNVHYEAENSGDWTPQGDYFDVDVCADDNHDLCDSDPDGTCVDCHVTRISGQFYSPPYPYNSNGAGRPRVPSIARVIHLEPPTAPPP